LVPIKQSIWSLIASAVAVRVVAFNTLEHWANDVSKDIAQMIQARCDIAGDTVPEHIQDFVQSYAPTTRHRLG
jgi:hypothetical protein